MERNKAGFFVILLLFIACCQQHGVKNHSLFDIEAAFKNGQLSLVNQLVDSILTAGKADSVTQKKLKSLRDQAARIRLDFTLNDSVVGIMLKKEFEEYSPNERVVWEENNWLEYRIIDGEKRYFKRAVPNLKLMLAHEQFKQSGTTGMVSDRFSLFCLDHSRNVLRSSAIDGHPVLPVKMKVTYRLTLKADAVPDGETVRCWMPWPKEVHNRQSEVLLISTLPEIHFVEPDTVGQRSIYFEQKASQGKPVHFEIQFSYESRAQYFDLKKLKVIPYDTTSAVYKKNTVEQYPQIVFTKQIKVLSDSLVKDIENPVEKVKKIYYWINDHVTWTGAFEYSIMPDIPGYVLKNRRGDCGMQTLLFMTMARCQGIPVKWQSGWMMHPDEVNLHDWCEVFYNGIGWVPLDMSFNLQNSTNIPEKEFYISGIDAYRLIVNDAIGSRFVPDKKFDRSEPYDFQRGEVEWRGGNLYFNQWNYEMVVEYAEPVIN